MSSNSYDCKQLGIAWGDHWKLAEADSDTLLLCLSLSSLLIWQLPWRCAGDFLADSGSRDISDIRSNQIQSDPIRSNQDLKHIEYIWISYWISYWIHIGFFLIRLMVWFFPSKCCIRILPSCNKFISAKELVCIRPSWSQSVAFWLLFSHRKIHPKWWYVTVCNWYLWHHVASIRVQKGRQMLPEPSAAPLDEQKSTNGNLNKKQSTKLFCKGTVICFWFDMFDMFNA